VTGDFRIVLPRPGPRVEPPLALRVEFGAAVARAELPALERALVERFRSALRVTPRIEWLPPGALPSEAHKTRHIVVEPPGAAQT
jgi:phenylacetate-CoA ligase